MVFDMGAGPKMLIESRIGCSLRKLCTIISDADGMFKNASRIIANVEKLTPC